MRGAEISYFGVSGGRLLRRLGEPLYGRRYGRVRTLNDLARAGLPVPDGVVLTEEAHEVFLEASGVVEGVKAAAWREENPKQKHSIEVVAGNLRWGGRSRLLNNRSSEYSPSRHLSE